SGEASFADGDWHESFSYIPAEGSAATKGYFGTSVATGDVNGDGYDDVIIAAPQANSVFVFFGMKTIGYELTQENADVTFSSSALYYGKGLAVNDVDADGIDDILIGSYTANTYTGEAHLYWGRTDWKESYSKPDITFKGEKGYSSYTYFGFNVWIGDVDNDGYGDILVASPQYYERVYAYEYWEGSSCMLYYNYTGLTHIFFGKARADWTKTTVDANAGDWDVRIKGWMPIDYFYYSSYPYHYRRAYMGMYAGQAIHTGNFNGDDYNDIVVGSYQSYNYPRIYSAGAVWMIPGRSRADWLKDGGRLDLMKKQGEYALFTTTTNNAYYGMNPRLEDLDGDGLDDFISCDKLENGHAYVVWGTTNMTTLLTNTRGSFPTGGHMNIISDVADIVIDGFKESGTCAVWVDDFDQDNKNDLLIGGPGGIHENGAVGTVGIIYGGDKTFWGTSKNLDDDADWKVTGEVGDAMPSTNWGGSLYSGDLNADGYPDILIGCAGWNADKGRVYAYLTEDPFVEGDGFALEDGSGLNGDVLAAQSGGIPKEDTRAMENDGSYTFNVTYNNSWSPLAMQEFRLNIILKGNYFGLVYTVAYSPSNDTFYFRSNPVEGMMISPKSHITIHSAVRASVVFNVIFMLSFPSQDPVDIRMVLDKGPGNIEYFFEDMFRVESDFVLNVPDITVMNGDEQVSRGSYLPFMNTLNVTAGTIVYQDTDVPVHPDFYFIRLFDSYDRVYDIYADRGEPVQIDLPVDTIRSGEYLFEMGIIMTEYSAPYSQAKTIIPSFFVVFDMDGPDIPLNVQFRADSILDPEGRWDNDPEVFVTWDGAFDKQVGVNSYGYVVNGPQDTEGFAYFNEGTTNDKVLTFDDFVDIGPYTLEIWGIDMLGNRGRSVMRTLVIDTEIPLIENHYPSYMGGVWFNSKEVTVEISIMDNKLSLMAPSLDLDTLEYVVVDQELSAAPEEGWSSAGYNVISTRIMEERPNGGKQVKTTISVLVEVKEGKNNYLWWRVADQADNMGITTTVDVEGPVLEYEALLEANTTLDPNQKEELLAEFRMIKEQEAISKNPSNVWADITKLTYSDATPSEIQENNIVEASVIITDLLSHVDGSSIQYSYARDGLQNYGGWISAMIITDEREIVAETVTPMLFEPGSTNYIRWRAMDVAGNGYTYSEDIPIIIIPRLPNNPPTAIISTPGMEEVFNTQERIEFSAEGSMDPDENDVIFFSWILANKSIISDSESFSMDARDLGEGIHVITLYVSDGTFTMMDSISIYVKLHPDEVDTDGDGIPDGTDDDDDNDGLLDTDEDKKGTDPKLADSDRDGVNDKLDPEPLNNGVTRVDETKNELTYWQVFYGIIILAALIIFLGAMLVLKRRSLQERNRIERAVIMEGKLVERYEALTGIESTLLPSVKEFGMTLPPVAAQHVTNINAAEKAEELIKTPSLPAPTEKENTPAPETVQEEAPAPAPETAPAPVTPAPAVPKPERSVRRRRTTTEKPEATGQAPGAIPSPEELIATAALPEGAPPAEEAAPAQPTMTSCDLCGSSIEVPPGATSAECPLCGEKKNL
ncbi:MAG: FG-GAP repeat protein, partial [Thermoplasmata archaeon]|nr:FG-GAP repeat protein [Thermoplasmata archaeon]